MRIFFGHEPAVGFRTIQRAAAVAGLAYLDAGSHLCLHPKFGPWFTLRATLVFDAVEYNGALQRWRTAPVLSFACWSGRLCACPGREVSYMLCPPWQAEPTPALTP